MLCSPNSTVTFVGSYHLPASCSPATDQPTRTDGRKASRWTTEVNNTVKLSDSHQRSPLLLPSSSAYFFLYDSRSTAVRDRRYPGSRAMVKKFRWQEIRRRVSSPSEPPSPRLFSEPQWQGHVSLWYLLYRWSILGCWLAFIVCSILDIGSKKPEGGKETWPIYLTHWDLVLGAAQASLGALLVTRRHSEQRNQGFDPDSLTLGRSERIYWVLYTVTSSTAICVTTIYWSMIFDPKIHVKDPLNFMLHLFNTILMLLDLIIVGIPIRFEHFWWPLVCGLFYIIFSMIYYFAGGLDKHGYHYIYKILDWQKPGRTVVVCIGVLVFLAIIHCFLSSLAQLRAYVRYKSTGRIVTMSMVAHRHNTKTDMQFPSAASKSPVELIV